MVRGESLNFIVVSAVIIFQINASAATVTSSFVQQTSNAGRVCDADQLEYKLDRFEVKLKEDSDRLISELRDVNQRLRAVENQEYQVETALKGFSTELGCTNSSPPVQSLKQKEEEELESRLNNLVKEVQLVKEAQKILNSSLVSKLQDLPSKQFLTKSLSEINLSQGSSIPHVTFDITKFQFPKSRIPKSCKDVLNSGEKGWGLYQIQPEHAAKSFQAQCIMDTMGGGWTIIQLRYDGTQDFFLNWQEYKTGFGNIGGEFWLGLEKIHQLTGYENTELLVQMYDQNWKLAYAHYASFRIGSEDEGYSLKVLGGYTGDAGDSLSYHVGSRFSTKDHDQDQYGAGSCAQHHTGAWWYNNCDRSNLNGKYLIGQVPASNIYQGIYWESFGGGQQSLRYTRIMVR